MNLQSLLTKAGSSSFYRWLLNLALDYVIPFNSPHGFSVVELSDHHVSVRLPYRRSNFNHIRGIHACALATVSEFSTGLLLIRRLDPKKFRLIMQRLEMDYHYQGKTDAMATFRVSDEWLQEKILAPLATDPAVIVPCEVQINDKNGNLLTTGRIYWQVKDWSKVRTKVS